MVNLNPKPAERIATVREDNTSVYLTFANGERWRVATVEVAIEPGPLPLNVEPPAGR